MREILFRGKRTDNGECVEGGIYVQNADDIKDEAVYIIGGSLNDVGCAYPVDPETVGEYTGKTDKNGKKIFEGDIVKYGETVHKVVFEQRNKTAYFGIVYNEQETLPFGHYQDLKQIKVIGNIYDNPELLKGGAE